MSASKISWLKIGGMTLLAVGVVYATTKLNRSPAPRAEISPATLTSDDSPALQSRTQFPTILRVKPVAEAAPTFSPRYAPRDVTLPTEVPRPDRLPAGNYPLPTNPQPTPVPVTPLSVTPLSVTPLSEQPAPGSSGGQSASPVDHKDPPSAGPNQSTEAAISPTSGEPAAIAAESTLPSATDFEPADLRPADMPTTYITIAQDSFWNISKLRYGGEGRYFKALYFHNRGRILHPDQIPAGIEIETPTAAELRRLYPDLCQLGQRR